MMMASPSTTQHGTDEDKKSFAALRVPSARVYLSLMGLVMMADSIEHVIGYWVIFQRYDSPALAGFAVVSHWIPFLLLSVHVGLLADRFEPRRLIQIGMVLFIIGSLGWGGVAAGLACLNTFGDPRDRRCFLDIRGAATAA